MRAMVASAPGQPLTWTHVPDPAPGPDELLVAVDACGVCRTDLHVVDGEIPATRYPVVPGHEIVGRVLAVGAHVTGFVTGDRVGVPWLASTCGQCEFCLHDQENLCDGARFTGCTKNGGYAELVAADWRYCFHLPEGPSDSELAPWLCAGLIGYRSYRMTGDAKRVGIYGFGAAAHIIAQLLAYDRRPFYAFTRRSDIAAAALASELGAAWSGPSDELAPEPLDAAIIFAPAGELVPKALENLRKGGVVVCGGIHMSDIPSFPYRLLWGERRLVSVANLTRRDGEEFIERAQRARVRTHTRDYSLSDANEALAALRRGAFMGAAVLRPDL
jgi:propanol-preferring alcohol dehydrogenase